MRARRHKAVTLRLALSYGALFAVSSLIVLAVSYLYLRTTIQRITDAEILETATELKTLLHEAGPEAFREEMKREAQSWGEDRAFFVLRSATGGILASSDLGSWGGQAVIRGFPRTRVGEQPTFSTVSTPSHAGTVRLLTLPAGRGTEIDIGQSLHAYERIMSAFYETSLLTLAVMLLAGTGVAFVIARRAMSGVRRLATVASQIGKDNLAARVSIGDEGQEIDGLAKAFNGMLERIAALVQELTEVTDNIAHDLRSPVARIRGIAEMAVVGKGDLDAYKNAAGAIIEESDRLIAMINTMLEITQTESGTVPLASETVHLQALLRDAEDLFAPVAASKGVSLGVELSGEDLVVSADLRKLQRAVANLIDNAIKYTPREGKVTIALGTVDREARVTVSDTGVGIDPRERVHIFERFRRGDKSRSTPGNGLGLSLALAIVRAHGGDITVESRPGKGSTFTIHLPRS